MMIGNTTIKQQDPIDTLPQKQRAEELARCRQYVADYKAVAGRCSQQLGAHTGPTVAMLLAWAHYAREAGRWMAASVRLSEDGEQPEPIANVDYLDGSHGTMWRWLRDVTYEHTGYPCDGVSLDDLGFMAQSGQDVSGRDDLNGAYRKFLAKSKRLDVESLLADLHELFPVVAAELPKPPPRGEWSIWMNKRDIETLLDCDGRHFDDLYRGEIARRGRQQWRFRLDLRDQEIRQRYRDWLKNRIG